MSVMGLLVEWTPEERISKLKKIWLQTAKPEKQREKKIFKNSECLYLWDNSKRYVT